MCLSNNCWSCRACFLQVLLVLLNTCLLLGGLLVAGIGGVLVAISQGSLTSVVQGIVSNIIDLGSLGPSEGSAQDAVAAAAPTDLTQLLQPTGIALIVIGGTMLAISLIGYCGGGIAILLKTYCVILLVVVVIEIVLVALLFSGIFNPYVMAAANETLVDNYVDLRDKGIVSMMWNLVMIKWECCGLTGSGDFLYTRHSWPRNVTVASSDNNGQSQTFLFVTPLACCRTSGQFPKVRYPDDHCAITPNNNNSNYMTGCWDKLSDDLSSFRVWIIVAFSAAIALKAVMALLALCVAKNSNKISPV